MRFYVPSSTLYSRALSRYSRALVGRKALIYAIHARTCVRRAIEVPQCIDRFQVEMSERLKLESEDGNAEGDTESPIE